MERFKSTPGRVLLRWALVIYTIFIARGLGTFIRLAQKASTFPT